MSGKVATTIPSTKLTYVEILSIFKIGASWTHKNEWTYRLPRTLSSIRIVWYLTLPNEPSIENA